MTPGGGLSQADQRLKELAEESVQWHDDFREGMFHIHCHNCGAGEPYLPPEFFGLLESENELALGVLRLLSEQKRWLDWSGGQYPDDSPGDVISAESDGTIVLDDGITTWNSLRAAVFLAGENARLLSDREGLMAEVAQWEAWAHSAVFPDLAVVVDTEETR